MARIILRVGDDRLYGYDYDALGTVYSASCSLGTVLFFRVIGGIIFTETDVFTGIRKFYFIKYSFVFWKILLNISFEYFSKYEGNK